MGRVVIVCYRPKPGKAAALRRLIVDHVPTLRGQRLVTGRAPIIMEAKDGTVIEVFEWNSAEAIAAAHTNPVVQAMWKVYSEVCDHVALDEVPEALALFAEFTPIDEASSAPPVQAGLPASRPARPAPPHRPGPPDPIDRRRNEFGDPRDTAYVGGTPNFDETGPSIGKPGKRRP